MEIHRISRRQYATTIIWAVLLCSLIVSITATLARATFNFKAALTDKPDLAVYMLLPDEHIKDVTLLRDNGDERHYLTETDEGKKIVILKKGEEEWYVWYREGDLRE